MFIGFWIFAKVSLKFVIPAFDVEVESVLIFFVINISRKFVYVSYIWFRTISKCFVLPCFFFIGTSVFSLNLEAETGLVCSKDFAASVRLRVFKILRPCKEHAR